MKTIEERADAYVGHPFEIDEFSSATAKRQAFIDGAKEQRKIDIDKACKWLKENARDYACATIRCYGDEDEIICDVHQEIVEDFRKAIEEEL